MDELRRWLIAHLQEAHSIEVEQSATDERFVPYPFSDLKAAHDLLHESTVQPEASDIVGGKENT